MDRNSKITEAEMERALASIDIWQTDRSKAPASFCCDTATLDVVDASVRPHAEWYMLTCQGCGRKETIHRPIGRPRLAEEL